MKDLADHLRRIMEDHEPPFTALGLAKKLGYPGNWMVSSVLNRERAIPVDDIEKWANALGLKDEAKAEFIVVANCERSPVFIREYIRQITSEMKHLRQDLARIKRKAHDAIDNLEEAHRTIADLRKRLAKYEAA